jgi:hypothetical protein
LLRVSQYGALSESAWSGREWMLLGGLGLFRLSLARLLSAEQKTGAAPLARSCVLFLLHGGPK